MPDEYESYATGLGAPLIGGFAITPSDSADLPTVTREIRITGSGGTIAVVWLDGSTTTEPIESGAAASWRVRRVLATGTTATGIKGYY